MLFNSINARIFEHGEIRLENGFKINLEIEKALLKFPGVGANIEA